MDTETGGILTNIIIRLKKSRFFGDLLSNGSAAQFTRYFIIGASSFFLEYLLFFICIKLFDLWAIYANTIVFTIIFIFNFILNRIWTFQSKASIKKQFLRYFILFLFNLGATNGVIYLLSDIGSLSPFISKIIVMCAIVPWNFIMYKKVIYR